VRGETALIGLDWGTTTLRVYRFGASGELLERRRAELGILRVVNGAFEDALFSTIGDWLTAEKEVAVIASGMITSRQGWVETPYLPCPAGAEELAAALTGRRLRSGHRILFVPGLSTRGADGMPDVMRGEETQILGALAAGVSARLLILPGTHSKWVRCAGDRIAHFATMMTGEFYDVLRRHSILGRLMEGDAPDAEAFARGVAFGTREDAASGGLLRRLFSVRSLGLCEEIPAGGLASYLSGLLIGSELREGRAMFGDAGPLGLIGETGLVRRYREALAACGREGAALPGDPAARGLFLLARRAGVTPG